MGEKTRTMAERLEQFQNAIEEILKKETQQEGLEWELFDISYEGQGVYAAKFGIYPWGVTIAEGALEDFRQIVKEIIEEVKNAYWICPYCQKKLNWREMTVDRECSCGARFEISTARGYDEEFIHDNNVKWSAREGNKEADALASKAAGMPMAPVSDNGDIDIWVPDPAFQPDVSKLAELPELNWECETGIRDIVYAGGKAKFGDYVKLRTGGLDGYSRTDMESLKRVYSCKVWPGRCGLAYSCRR